MSNAIEAADGDVRERERVRHPGERLEVRADAPVRRGLVDLAGVLLEEVDLPDPEERPGRLRLVAERVHDLVDVEREVPVGAHPEREYRVHRGLARGA
jgi:hypothetical protein